MIDVTPEQARTLAAILTEGSFDAAAVQLRLTPSAVSQRMRALEVAVGRPVVRRTRPVELTASGEAVVRYARQLDLLSQDLTDELEPGAGEQPRLALVINSDSLGWVLPALVEVADRVQIEVLREDQDHSLDLLRRGGAAAAITSVSRPVPGCSVRRLGAMIYRPVAHPELVARWFADGPTPAAFRRAPVVVFDRNDDLQDRYLRRHAGRQVDPPRHFVPASHEYGMAIKLGLGWGLLPEQQLGTDLDTGALIELPNSRRVIMALYWQQWRRSPTALTTVATAVATAAAAALDQDPSGPPARQTS